MIDAGVFHNDVISVGSTSLLFFHEHAFLNTDAVLGELNEKLGNDSFYPLKVTESEISVQDAVATYLFNTQLLDLSGADKPNEFLLIAPSECQEHKGVKRYLDNVLDTDAPITQIRYFNLRESMKNGGGPACLRLRVVLSEIEINAIKPRIMLDEALYQDLKTWVKTHYRDALTFADLRDPNLIDELRTAALDLETILEMPGLYGIN